MNGLAAILMLLLQAPQEAFTRFTYCHDAPRVATAKRCLSLTPDGKGQSRFQEAGSKDIELPLTLSSAAQERFRAVIAATNNLANSENYETRRRVADVGRKRLTLEIPSGTREASFNYSDLKEVIALATFFDSLLNQQNMIFELETSARYERLSVPDRLDQLDSELKLGRIGDPPALIPALDKIIDDTRLLEYARDHARQIKSRLMLGQEVR